MLTRLVVPLACASLMLAGCGGNAKEPGADERRAQGTGGGSRQITLEGCIATGTGTDEYVLQHVHVLPTSGQASDVQSAPGTTITEGSWVKLRMGDDDPLRNNVGRKVSVTGTVVDSGVNTIGTSGQPYGPDEPEPRTDRTQAAAREHHSEKIAKEAGPIGQQSMANGTAPEIAVERVTPTNEKCKG